MIDPTSIPFPVPQTVDLGCKAVLSKAGLTALFEMNRESFIDCMALLYRDVTLILREIPSSPPLTFNAFCDLAVEELLAAPTQLNKASKDKDGQFAVFFGQAIVDVISPLIPIQDWYGTDGDKRHDPLWRLAGDFVTYVCVESFKAGIHSFDEDQLTQASMRVLELQKGKRELRAVASAGPYGRSK